MLYTIYQVTHKESGKIYIGKHQTLNAQDDYMGSGNLIRNAIKKHGRDAFDKEVLFIFPTEKEMNDKEIELVTEEFCLRKDTYNMCPGGQGGWGYVVSTRSKEDKIAYAANAGRANKGILRGPLPSETREKMSKAASRPAPWFKGNSHASGSWMNNGTIERKAKDGIIPDGWAKGRLKKPNHEAI